ncbi:MAG TPA: DUF721 domain-containing protein [Candidatus Ozemobacteraceae bacterium]|nr:DUF721 domain-containing protein [Candidatus Ozemobacteraceae bacterium]
MNAGTPRSRGSFKAAGSVLSEVLAGLKRQVWEARYGEQGGRGFSMRVARAAGMEMLQLGRLRKAWPTMVGPDLARHSAPDRLFQGKLFVVCKDSQWMQTFTFVRVQVLERVRQLCPDSGVKSVVARLGRLPARSPVAQAPDWPDWHAVKLSKLPLIQNRELYDTLTRCRAKLQARREALAQAGMKPCPQCNGVPIPAGVRVCASCRHQERLKEQSKLRNLLDETPWLTLDETREQIPSVSIIEFEAAKSDLLCEVNRTVEALGTQLKETFDEAMVPRLRLEMLRSVILQTGVRPDAMTPEAIDALFPAAWRNLLENAAGKEARESGEC